MSSRVVQIKWLKENQADVVPLSRIVAKKNKGIEIQAGSIVNVKYKSGFHKAEILDMNPPKRRIFNESSSEDSDDDVPLSELKPTSPPAQATMVAPESASPPPSAAPKPASPPPSAAPKPASPPPSAAPKPASPPPSAAPGPASPPPSAALKPASPPPSAAPGPASPTPLVALEPASPPPSAASEPASPPQLAALEPASPPLLARSSSDAVFAELLALPGLVRTLISQQKSMGDDMAQLSRKVDHTNRLQTKLLEYIRAKDATKSPSASPATPRFLDGSTSDDVIIGGGRATTSMKRAVYEDKLLMSTSGKHLVLKLVGHLFRDDELVCSNVNGGPTRTAHGIVHKRALIDEERYQAILVQAEKEFPGDTVGMGARAIRDAVNNKCKKASQRVGGN